MNNINKKFNNLLTIGNIPASYNASMSYEEQLLWLINIMEKEIIPDINEIINFINNMEYSFDEINQRINLLAEEINFVRQEYERINSQVNTNTQNIISLNNKIDNKINELNQELRELINSNFNTLKSYVDYQDNVLNEKIDNIQIGAINVYDPTTGILSPLQVVINNLYTIGNKDGLTASEFDTLELTATAFDAYQITAYEFDSQGKSILV